MSESGVKMMILVGLPGSGKSTKVKELQQIHPDAVVCSADHYFTSADGCYNFDATQLHRAHQACQQKAMDAMVIGKSCVIIDNTNVRLRDRRAYSSMALGYGYKVEEVVIGEFTEAFVDVCAQRNVHGVPRDVIAKMAHQYTEGRKTELN